MEAQSRRGGLLRQRLVHAVLLAGSLLFGASCGDRSATAPNALDPGRASLAIAPVFQSVAPGTPDIPLSKIVGILISPSNDSIVVESSFVGGVATLNFDLQFSGAPRPFTLDITAYDLQGIIAYHASASIIVRAGRNGNITAPTLIYAAPDSKVTTLKVGGGSTSLVSGGTTTFSVSGTGPNGAITPIRVGWTSTDPTIATVDAGGVVTAGNFQGKTYIVARTAVSVSDSVLVNVKAPVDKITIAPPSDVIRGRTATLVPDLRDAGNHLIDDRAPVWTTSDTSIATVSATGVVTGIKIGTARITATSEGKTATTNVNIVTPIDHIELTPIAVNFSSLTATSSLTLRLVPKTGAATDGIAVVYSTSDRGIATVDDKGIVTAVASGTAKITATADGVSATTDVTVRQITAEVVVSPRSASVSSVGSGVAFTVVILDSLHNPVKSPVIVWTSTDPSIATVSTDGLAIGLRGGTVRIIASSGGVADTATFAVSPIGRALLLSSDRAQIAIGGVATLRAVITDGNGNIVSAGGATLTNTTPNVASLSGNTLTGLSSGTAHITAAFGSFTAAVDVVVGAGTTPGSGGVVTGVVINAATNTPIAGAAVGTGTVTSTAATDGSFTLNGVPSQSTLTISATGFVTTQYFNVALVNGVAQVGNIPLAPVSTAPGTVTGQVIDATTGRGVPSTIVTFRSGVNATSGSGSTASTDAQGFYTTSLPAGTYTASATAPGFSIGTATAVSIGGQTHANQNVSIVPSSGIRITLTWGADPRDLDSHLFGPTATGARFHTYFGNPVGPDGESLDHDETAGFGPENTTVLTTYPGTYRFFVYHFSGTGSMAASGATVTVRKNGIVIGVFHPPARPNEQSGDIWDVFSFDGTTITGNNQFITSFAGVSSVNPVGRSTATAGSATRSVVAPRTGTAADVAAIQAAVAAHPKTPPRRP